MLLFNLQPLAWSKLPDMKLFRILYVQVIIGIIAGVIVGYCFPAFAPTAKLISETFINLIKMMIGPVIFFSIVLGIAGAESMKKVGRVGGKGILYFEIVTTAAIIIGIIAADIIKPGTGVKHQAVTAAAVKPAGEMMNWSEFLSHIVPSNVIDSFAKGDILQILFFGILFAAGLNKLGDTGRSITAMFDKLNKALFSVLGIVIKASPVGAFGGMAYTIGKFGFSSLIVLGKLLATFYITGLLFIFVVLNLICRYNGFSLWKLLGYIKAELLIVFGASSSEAALPLIMEKLENAGCEKSVVGLIVPAGYSFNLDGTSIYLSLSVIFLAQLFSVPLTLGQELSVIAVLLITSKGAAGVTGSGFLVLTSTLTALKVIPLEGLPLLIGVDRFMSEGRAIINIIGNSVATLVVAKSEKAIDMPRYKQVVEKA